MRSWNILLFDFILNHKPLMHFKGKFFDLISSIDVSNMELWSNEQIFGFLENTRMDYRQKPHFELKFFDMRCFSNRFLEQKKWQQFQIEIHVINRCTICTCKSIKKRLTRSNLFGADLITTLLMQMILAELFCNKSGLITHLKWICL